MARYRTTVPSARTPEDTFAYLADFRTLPEWDPATASSTLVSGSEPGQIGATFHVRTRFGRRDVELDYTVLEADAPRRIVLQAQNGPATSTDTIIVEPLKRGGCVVTYDARLQLRGLSRLADPVVAILLHRVGDRAQRTLTRRLAQM